MLASLIVFFFFFIHSFGEQEGNGESASTLTNLREERGNNEEIDGEKKKEKEIK